MSDANAAGLQGIKELNIIPSDFLNNLNQSNSSAATSASASLSVRDWGVHNNNIDFAGGTSLNIKQVLLWGGIGLFGWWIIRKIRGK